jgi:hypothetical protein
MTYACSTSEHHKETDSPRPEKIARKAVNMDTGEKEKSDIREKNPRTPVRTQDKFPESNDNREPWKSKHVSFS